MRVTVNGAVATPPPTPATALEAPLCMRHSTQEKAAESRALESVAVMSVLMDRAGLDAALNDPLGVCYLRKFAQSSYQEELLHAPKGQD